MKHQPRQDGVATRSPDDDPLTALLRRALRQSPPPQVNEWLRKLLVEGQAASSEDRPGNNADTEPADQDAEPPPLRKGARG
jgi:hypothetical protein